MATQKKTYQTIPAPAPGSKLRFRGGGSRGGKTPDELKKYLAADGSPIPGAPTEIGTGGVWGADGASVTGYGTVQSANLRRMADREVYPDNNGEATAYVYFNYRYEGSVECLVPSSFTALEPGDTLSVGGQTLYVNQAEERWQYRGWKLYSVQCDKHDTINAT
jgi:hypothetical protein